jgi:hemerythrin-like domain-containing protein
MTAAIAADTVELQVLEHEHRRVRDGLASLQEALGSAELRSRPEAIDRTARALHWLRRDVLPHAAWEEAWLYPRLDATAGTPWATRALRFEHEQIRELAASLETAFVAVEAHWTPEAAFQLALAMARLETLISAHLAQEQWFVSPLLDRAV